MLATLSTVPAMRFGRETGEPAGEILPAERAPLGPRPLDAGARLLLLDAAANHIEEMVVGLGLAAFVTQLQDACFAALLPVEYEQLERSLGRTLADDAGRLGVFTTALRRLVQRAGIACALQGRIKGLYSLYCKMVRKGRGLEGIRDRAGMRIIVRSIDDYYRVLGLIHTHFAYVPGTFDDYIGAPKANGYRSLHTCVSAVDHLTAEIQIRTLQMHLEAEYGRAAHWRYKRSDGWQSAAGGRHVRTLLC
jgi:(p)ppGpp synthase/HD superfamily hydrolase